MLEYSSGMLRSLVVLLLVVSVAGFFLSLAVHVATFFSINLGGIWRFFWFQIGIFVVFIPTIAIYRYKEETFLPSVFPRWSRMPLYVLFGYFIFNMVFLMLALHGGSPELVNGAYQLTDHGRLIRYLTEEEYLRFTNYELRFFSSGWMIFYAGTAAYLWHLRDVVTSGFREIRLEP
jgi:hypothetical protein